MGNSPFEGHEDPDHSYRLLYGNENARTPHYDLEHLVSVEAQTKSVVLRAALGPEELTSNYFDPRPFTERHPRQQLAELHRPN